jgi:hypothetical protein
MQIVLLITLIIFLLVFSSGCTSTSNDSVKTVNANDISSKIHYFQTFSRGYDSNNDKNQDSIIINPILKDSQGNTLKVTGINLPMDIEIRNSYTDKGDIMPKYKTDHLYSGRIIITESPNQKSTINIDNINFENIRTYKDSYGVYGFIIDFTLHLPDGRELTYEEMVSINRWKNL